MAKSNKLKKRRILYLRNDAWNLILKEQAKRMNDPKLPFTAGFFMATKVIEFCDKNLKEIDREMRKCGEM